MKLFSPEYFNNLTEQAKASTRLRQHQNVHQSFRDPCQRLFNAIEPGSYIRPHRHSSDPRDELLIAVRGLMALLTFDDNGNILSVAFLGAERFGVETCAAVEIPPAVWHTLIALETGCVLLEVKAGPFDTSRPKDLAFWAPEEGSIYAPYYLGVLEACLKARR